MLPSVHRLPYLPRFCQFIVISLSSMHCPASFHSAWLYYVPIYGLLLVECGSWPQWQRLDQTFLGELPHIGRIDIPTTVLRELLCRLASRVPVAKILIHFGSLLSVIYVDSTLHRPVLSSIKKLAKLACQNA